LVTRDPVIREFLLAFWKVHILHHSGERGVYGQWMLQELQEHGYRLSPGTLYPILARMARRGWLSATEPKRAKAPRLYRLTPHGHEVLTQILESLDELYREVGQHRLRKGTSRQKRSQRPHRQAHRRPSP
jgi:DNA-binding PadR family transcriptional regulator